ncbi:MAG TPA: hypothetical protein VJR29_14125 [bacterium]|nr:hypothetical protein [bacterium]HKY64539.1 hypothetical protein [bacterium]
MKKAPKRVPLKAPAPKDQKALLKSLLKQMDELLVTNRRQSQEVQMLKEEVEGLRRDLSITMESLAELPYVNGTLH